MTEITCPLKENLKKAIEKYGYNEVRKTLKLALNLLEELKQSKSKNKNKVKK